MKFNIKYDSLSICALAEHLRDQPALDEFSTGSHGSSEPATRRTISTRDIQHGGDAPKAVRHDHAARRRCLFNLGLMSGENR